MVEYCYQGLNISIKACFAQESVPVESKLTKINKKGEIFR